MMVIAPNQAMCDPCYAAVCACLRPLGRATIPVQLQLWGRTRSVSQTFLDTRSILIPLRDLTVAFGLAGSTVLLPS